MMTMLEGSLPGFFTALAGIAAGTQARHTIDDTCQRRRRYSRHLFQTYRRGPDEPSGHLCALNNRQSKISRIAHPSKERTITASMAQPKGSLLPASSLSEASAAQGHN
jgi:hypothetical protein